MGEMRDKDDEMGTASPQRVHSESIDQVASSLSCATTVTKDAVLSCSDVTY